MEDQWLHFQREGGHRALFLDLSFWGKYWNTGMHPSNWPTFLINFHFMRGKPHFSSPLDNCWRHGLPASVGSPHTACVVAPSFQAGYCTNVCNALVNNLWQAGGDKGNTPILSQMPRRHGDRGRLRGEGSWLMGPPSVEERGHRCKENEM